MALLDDVRMQLEVSISQLQGQISDYRQILDRINSELAAPSTEARLNDLIDKANSILDGQKATLA